MTYGVLPVNHFFLCSWYSFTSQWRVVLYCIVFQVKELANKAKNNQLKPEEYQGGTFTVSNLGMFGIVSFSAVINPPQACILAIGGGVPRVIVPENGKGEPKVITSLTVQLSADRRVVDEEVASRFLQVIITNDVDAVDIDTVLILC
jgi:pyruvate dehydrogenase E2 component (dihydrolipoamide acetyltransferase)